MELSCKKLCIGSLKDVVRVENRWSLKGLHFQKVWIQGVVIKIENNEFYLDDSTGVIIVHIAERLKTNQLSKIQKGTYHNSYNFSEACFNRKLHYDHWNTIHP
jgi:hypothetical protein